MACPVSFGYAMFSVARRAEPWQYFFCCPLPSCCDIWCIFAAHSAFATGIFSCHLYWCASESFILFPWLVRCSILGFHSLCMLPSLWQFSACLCCDFICRQIHDALSFAGPAAFTDVVSAGDMLCFILSVGFVSILRTDLSIRLHGFLH